jgi:hypothetical protein
MLGPGSPSRLRPAGCFLPRSPFHQNAYFPNRTKDCKARLPSATYKGHATDDYYALRSFPGVDSVTLPEIGGHLLGHFEDRLRSTDEIPASKRSF